jgi:hypothetical protein
VQDQEGRDAGGDGRPERRRWPRANAHGLAGCSIYTPTVTPVVELSQDGALVEVPCLLRARSICALKVALAPDTVLLLRASVVRSYADHLRRLEQGELSMRCHAALQFIDPSDREKTLLRQRVLSGAAASERTQPAAARNERRGSERASLEGGLEGELGLRLSASVMMLSQGGMLVRMPFAPHSGALVGCSFEIEGQAVRIDAIVRDACAESLQQVNPQQLVGLEFLGPGGPARAAIDSYMARSPR